MFIYQMSSSREMDKKAMLFGLIDILLLILMVSFLMRIISLSGSLLYLQAIVFIVSLLLAGYSLLNLPDKKAWMATLLLTVIFFIDQIIVWTVANNFDMIPLISNILLFIPALGNVAGGKSKKRSTRAGKRSSKRAKGRSKKRR